MFSTNNNGFNKFCRGLPNKHFYQIILESIKEINSIKTIRFPTKGWGANSEEKNSKDWAFCPVYDATETKVFISV